MLEAGIPAGFGLWAALAFAGWCACMGVVIFISAWRSAPQADAAAVSSVGEKLGASEESGKGADVGGRSND